METIMELQIGICYMIYPFNSLFTQSQGCINIMKNYSLLLAVFLACFCLAGCEGFSPFNAKKNVLIIKPASTTRADNGVVREDGSRVYRIGSLFAGGAIPSSEYSVPVYCFYEGEYSSWFEPQNAHIRPLVIIEAIKYTNIEYSNPGDEIIDIRIGGIESSDFGSGFVIRMNQGKYESAAKMVMSDEASASGLIKYVETDATEWIESVKINSFKIPYYATDDNADINIVIKSKAGGTITLLYSDSVQALPWT